MEQQENVSARQIVCADTAWEFSAGGVPASFRRLPEGKERLSPGEPGRGFYLLGHDRQEIRLSRVTVAHGRLTAASGNESQRAVFRLQTSGRYFALYLEHLYGIPTNSGLTLHFEMNAAQVGILDADYMTDAQASEQGVRCAFPYLWHRHSADPLGGFILYAFDSPEDEEEKLLEIWAGEQLPHPRVDYPWTKENARRWLTEWQETFRDRSELVAEADSPAELYTLADYAHRAGARQFFLFTNTWRNDAFWPDAERNWDIKKRVFPRGEADVQAFSQYLQERDMYLVLHYVSGGIGFHDPLYIGTHPDRRLASWGRGTLAQAADETADTLRFRPDPGCELPYRVPFCADNVPPYGMMDYFHYDHIRIGDEIVRVTAFEDTDQEIWTLKGCERGMYTTHAAPHEAGEETVGLFTTYGVNFLPDNDSDMLREMAEQWAGVLNRCRVGCMVFDGSEIHAYNGWWGYHKYAQFIYEATDHPTTSIASTGRPGRCWMEYRFASTKRLLRGDCSYMHGGYAAPLQMDSLSRPASNLLDAQYMFSLGHWGGALGIEKPEPMFGIRQSHLETYGRTQELFDLFRQWKHLSCRLTEEQQQMLDGYFQFPQAVFEWNHHENSRDLLTIRRQAGDLSVVPLRVLYDKKGGIPWQYAQEHGPLSARQFLRAGEAVTLVNDGAQAVPRFWLRVLPASAFAAETVPMAAVSADMPVEEVLFVVAGNAQQADDSPGDPRNIDITPDFLTLENRSDIRLTPGEDGMTVLTMENGTGQPMWSLEQCLCWEKRIDMRCHRGVGVEIEGDGSGAVLVLQIGGRDYAFTVDFIGRRVLEIANGEVSWYDPHWGWRLGNKSIRYSDVEGFRFGFGYIPPHTRARVGVGRLRLLGEQPLPLTDPILRFGDQRIQLRGLAACGDYIEYDGGTWRMYDRNWNYLREMEADGAMPVLPQGELDFSVEAENPVWLEAQIATELPAILSIPASEE